MKVTFIARSFFVLAILLTGTVTPAHSVPADMVPQATHAPAQTQTDAKIGSASHIQPLRPEFQFPYGQTFHFEGEWRFWTAGIATLRIEHSGSQGHVTATADSSGVVALLYRVQDRFNAYLDSKSLCSNKLMKHTEEGSHRRDTTITFDYGREKLCCKSVICKPTNRKKRKTIFRDA